MGLSPLPTTRTDPILKRTRKRKMRVQPTVTAEVACHHSLLTPPPPHHHRRRRRRRRRLYSPGWVLVSSFITYYRRVFG